MLCKKYTFFNGGGTFDPQTSGGLLFAVKASEAEAFLHELKAAGLPAAKVGRFVKRRDVPIYVN